MKCPHCQKEFSIPRGPKKIRERLQALPAGIYDYKDLWGKEELRDITVDQIYNAVVYLVRDKLWERLAPGIFRKGDSNELYNKPKTLSLPTDARNSRDF